jgi:aryl-alcohol dehydrogenase-like predicted oxidoreductase
MGTAVKPRAIGPFLVPPVGLGCMNLSHAYGAPPPAADAERLLLAALDEGITLFDTAALYGFGANETLVGRVLKVHRSRIVLCSKGGMAGVSFPDGVKRVIDGRPEAIRRNCEDSLKRLQTEVIDLYYLHRWDKAVPIEDSVGELSRLVAEGKVRHIGLSEVSATTLLKAHAVHPIAALQTEYSPWTRNPEIAVLRACREIGAAFVAFSPVARGVLTDTLPEPAAFDAKDIRRTMPRFTPDHWAANLALREGFAALAREAGCTLAQLSLAWVLSRGEHVLAIPGTTSLAHLRENQATLKLSLDAALLDRVSALMQPDRVSGNRYAAQSQTEVDTETFAA